MIIRGLLLGILPWALAQRDILINPKNGDDGASRVRSLPIDLSGLVNNVSIENLALQLHATGSPYFYG